MLTAHKPGIVPLRPLQFGDILDGAVNMGTCCRIGICGSKAGG